jgi:hypothetical protein
MRFTSARDANLPTSAGDDHRSRPTPLMGDGCKPNLYTENNDIFVSGSIVLLFHKIVRP